nr:hypothetical protein [uncultured Desulfobacter sp.]
MLANNQRDKALSLLDSNLVQLSKLFKECFLSNGKGALLLYASDILEGRLPTVHDYRKKDEILDLFNTPVSHDKLEVLINKYNPKKEGIITMITSYSNATFFVTVKLT